VIFVIGMRSMLMHQSVNYDVVVEYSQPVGRPGSDSLLKYYQ